MSPRPKPVRKFFNNDRLIALSDDSKPVVKHVPHATVSPQPADPVVPLFKKRVCPICGKTVKFNLRRGEYYSHNLPGDTTVCGTSGRATALDESE